MNNWWNVYSCCFVQRCCNNFFFLNNWSNYAKHEKKTLFTLQSHLFFTTFQSSTHAVNSLAIAATGTLTSPVAACTKRLNSQSECNKIANSLPHLPMPTISIGLQQTVLNITVDKPAHFPSNSSCQLQEWSKTKQHHTLHSLIMQRQHKQLRQCATSKCYSSNEVVHSHRCLATNSFTPDSLQ